MNFFLIGGSGFLGQYVIRELLQKDHVDKIYCLIHKTEIPIQNDKVIKIKGSIETLDSVRIEEPMDQCVVLSGVTDAKNIDEAMTIRVNYEGVKSAVLFCKKNQIPRICIVSSVNVKLARQGIYAKSKRKAENAVKESGLSYLIFRPALIFGHDGTKGLKVIENFIMKYGIVPVFGNGRKLEQPIWVGECAALMACYLLKDCRNRTIELYGKDAMTYNQMCRLIAKVKGRRAALFHVPVWMCELGLHVLDAFHVKFPVSREQIYHIDTNLTGDMENVYRETGIQGDSFLNNFRKQE